MGADHGAWCLRTTSALRCCRKWTRSNSRLVEEEQFKAMFQAFFLNPRQASPGPKYYNLFTINVVVNCTKKPAHINLDEKEFSKSSSIFLVTDHIAEEDIIYTLTKEDKNCSRRN